MWVLRRTRDSFRALDGGELARRTPRIVCCGWAGALRIAPREPRRFSSTRVAAQFPRLDAVGSDRHIPGRIRHDFGGLRRMSMSSGARIRRREEQEPSDTVRDNLRLALSGSVANLEDRQKAVERLCDLALPPDASEGAEDALYEVLQVTSLSGHAELREDAEDALRKLWHASGDAAIDESLQQGMSLLNKDQHEQAIVIFSSIIEKAPWFAEGWNKRATARFLLHDYDRSIADCNKVLELKPRHFGCLAGLGMCHQALDREQQAIEAFRRASEVHPGMDNLRQLVETYDLHQLVNEELRPQILRVARSLSGEGAPSEEPPAALEASAGDVCCDWDIHRVTVPQTPLQATFTYFLRVRIRNETSGKAALRSLARFYALCFSGGRIFPLMRVTEGESSFLLEPGQEYRFCFHVELLHEVLAGAGGVLLQHDGEEEPRRVGRELKDRFVYRDLGRKISADTTRDEVERWKLGYIDTGHLNLCHLNLGKLPSSSEQ
mmetsp:Transcript_139314/g.445439  ORF Transcript_139314/g.445439 Transcript_139314/m.445439 type:complete len:493 (-) Transcript_139314:8-1486(-)